MLNRSLDNYLHHKCAWEPKTGRDYRDPDGLSSPTLSIPVSHALEILSRTAYGICFFACPTYPIYKTPMELYHRMKIPYKQKPQKVSLGEDVTSLETANFPSKEITFQSDYVALSFTSLTKYPVKIIWHACR